MKKDNDIKYLVIIDDSQLDIKDKYWYQTTCSPCFYGYLINSGSHQSIFKLDSPTEALIIIPTDKIRWMIPMIKEKKEEE